jgi:chromate transporter
MISKYTIQLKLITEIFWRFILLGCVSFGGPAAHIGYFHRTFVKKLAWLTPDTYGQLVSLSQILPGPGSSQVGFALGLHRAGLLGAVAAFIGFTLPSFLLMYCLAIYVDVATQASWLVNVMYGLKLLAVVIVFDAILNMSTSFCKALSAKGIALASAFTLILFSGYYVQLTVLVVAALIGLAARPVDQHRPAKKRLGAKVVWWPLLLFFAVFALSMLFATQGSYAGLAAVMYQNGSLVFGGGQVILPLLQQSTGEVLSHQELIFSYAAAQGVPGPIFSIASYIGATVIPSAPMHGALVATLAIFLPGFLLVLALHNTWQSIMSKPSIAGISWAVNASVVGLLAAALYDPLLPYAVLSLFDYVMVRLGIASLRWAKVNVLVLLVGFILIGFLRWL